MRLSRIVVGVTACEDGSGWDVRVGELPPHRMNAHPLGHTRIPICHSTDIGMIEAILARLESGSPQRGDAKRYGQWLFECLLGPVWDAIRELPQVHASRGLELALQWAAGELALHPLIWEAMHDGVNVLAGHKDLLIAITRVVPIDVRCPSKVRDPRLLLAIGSAPDDEVIRPGAIQMGLLRSLEFAGVCTTRFATEVTVGELQELCAAFSPHIVHIVAHGSIDQQRCVLSLGGRSKPDACNATAGQLLAALTTNEHLAMVVLSACRSGSSGLAISAPEQAMPLAVELVAGGVPIVVAMTGNVGEQACRLYTRKLTEAVQNGAPIVEAAAKGRRAALVGIPEPEDYLDWAMPALFLASSVSPSHELVNPQAAKFILDLARSLDLRKNPIFVGRSQVLELVDRLFPDSHVRDPLGFIAVTRHGELSRLGGTRLLREMGYQLLKKGHIPLLLGPDPLGSNPTNLRAFVVDVITRMVLFTRHLGLEPIPFRTLGQVSATEADCLSANEALRRFKQAHDELDAPSIFFTLQEDLNAFAKDLGKFGSPFGEKSRPVLLCDEVHNWQGMLELLIKHSDSNGLGTMDNRIPVIVTSSTNKVNGGAMEELARRRNQPGYAFPPLNELTPGEYLLGFQWVLLNPWRESETAHGPVYAASNGASADTIRALLASLEGVPTTVDHRLYVLAETMVELNLLVKRHDEQDFAAYSRLLS